MLLTKKRVNSLSFLNSFKDKNTLKIGLIVTDKELKKIGVEKFVEGLAILPGAKYGPNSRKNAYGYSLADKTKEKVYKCINTIEWSWQQWTSGGGTETCSKLVDIYRYVYPKIEFPPNEIELVSINGKDGNQYLIANIRPEDFLQNDTLIKQTINMILEIFGYCQIFDEELKTDFSTSNIKRCNWKFLPEGVREMFVKRKDSMENDTKKRKNYLEYRLEVINNLNPIETYIGTDGFKGYYSFIFKNMCVLESSFYGNATYIITKDDWEKLSTMTKEQLLYNPNLIERVVHDSKWRQKFINIYNKFKE